MAAPKKLLKCTCRRKNCKRHGDCKACIEHHKKNKYPPYCTRKEKPT